MDLRFAWRALVRTPGFAISAIASLAIGSALIVSTMAVANAYLVRSLPYPAADRLYHVIYAPPGQPEPRGMTAIDWKSLEEIVEVADGSTGARFYLTDGGYTQESQGLLVAPGALEALGIRAALGRSFQREDFDARSAPVALIGHAFWRERFGSDEAVIGREFRASLNDQTSAPQIFRIVGVLPPDFRYVRDLSRNMEILMPLRSATRVYMVRLREGTPADLAERRITEAAKSAGSPAADWTGVRLEPVHGRYVSSLRPVLVAITAAAALVMVIVCTNVGILLLLRAAQRQNDVGIRIALGAGRSDIFRMLASEGCIICGLAFTSGLALAGFTLHLLAPVIEQQLGRPAPGGTAAIAIDTNVLFVTGLLAVLAAISLSLLPLLGPWERTLAVTLRRDTRTATDSPAMRKLRSGLMAFEIAGSLALLVGCGLMIRSAVNLLRADLGFTTRNIIRARIALPQRNYPDPPSLARFHERFLAALTASNTQAALTNWPPFYQTPMQKAETGSGNTVEIETGVTAVTAQYFSMLGIPIVRGRAFGDGDRISAEPVALVSETLAQRLWPAGDPIGKRIRTGEQPAARSPLGSWRTVVGVVSDVRQTYTDNDLREIYIPFLQAPNQYAPVFIRSDRPPSFWLASLRETLSGLDPEVLVSGVTSMAAEGDRLVAGTRFLTTTLTAFAAFAVLLAALGIYGATAYIAAQRKREVAIRMAVGATESTVVRMFLKEGSVVLVLGIAFGVFGANAITGILASQLYGVQPSDYPTLISMGAVIAAACLLATWWPAKRAALRNPIEALKEQ